MTTGSSARAGVLSAVDDLEAEQASLDEVLTGLADADWLRPTPATGWDVRDQVAHLADTDEVARDTLTEGPRAFATEVPKHQRGEDFTEAGCDRGRAMAPAQVLAWRRQAAGDLRAALRAADPAVRVPWGLGMGLRAFVTARLMEHWAHGLDVRAAVGADARDTERLRHVAWIASNALPYALRVAGVEPPADHSVRFELTAPAGPDQTWTFGPADATDVVRGPAGEWCRLAVQRIRRDQAPGLVADGPLAELALAHARAFL